jgi:DNA repair protein RecO (recombination protein O)
MPRFKDQAVCIREIDWSETSQVVALLTREHGKIRGLAKGSKRTSPGAIARFSGGIDLLTRGEVLATTKPTTDLATITEWDLQDPCRHLRTDLRAHHLGMYAADFVGALTMDHDPHPTVFDALVRFLEEIARSTAPEGGLLRFQWEVLEDCGFKPELERDAVTGQVLDVLAKPARAMLFDPRAGGVTLEHDESIAGSSIEDAGPWRVRGETIELLRQVARDPAAATALPAEAQRVNRANKLLCVYTRAILDRELPTMKQVLGKD